MFINNNCVRACNKHRPSTIIVCVQTAHNKHRPSTVITCVQIARNKQTIDSNYVCSDCTQQTDHQQKSRVFRPHTTNRPSTEITCVQTAHNKQTINRNYVCSLAELCSQSCNFLDPVHSLQTHTRLTDRNDCFTQKHSCNPRVNIGWSRTAS